MTKTVRLDQFVIMCLTLKEWKELKETFTEGKM